MKKRIISTIIVLSFLFSDIPFISKISFAAEDIINFDEYIAETEPTVVIQNIAPENVNWAHFEDEEDEQALNTRMNYDLTRSSLVSSNIQYIQQKIQV